MPDRQEPTTCCYYSGFAFLVNNMSLPIVYPTISRTLVNKKTGLLYSKITIFRYVTPHTVYKIKASFSQSSTGENNLPHAKRRN